MEQNLSPETVGNIAFDVRRLSGIESVAKIKKHIKGNFPDPGSRIQLDLSKTKDAYANGLAPMAAILDHYRRMGYKVDAVRQSSYISKTHVILPVRATPEAFDKSDYHWNKVWYYSSSDEAFTLTSEIILHLESRIYFESGVLTALRWSLYEVLDNVLEHAQTRRGFFCMQHLSASKRLAFCIADAGIGIHRSFATGRGHHKPRTATDAISLAIQRQTTSTDDRRGNGLYGLAEVIRQNGGQLEISSGRGFLRLSSGHEESELDPDYGTLLLDDNHHCTVVDFQLDTSHPISLQSIFPQEFDLRIQNMENDDGGYTLSVHEYANEVATREGGDRLRIRAINLIREGARPLTIDFTGTSIASASFIDEFIGKLGETLGYKEFFKNVALTGIDADNAALIRTMLARRIAD
ncbi:MULTISPECIES: DUF4325 domain-containing protein [unclassified Amycolatopsis]|uniref:DUF4325 domain-containing protein n=1 Tax=unclassified Amycolatopsis TaxID=2618356 RepID=UPI00106EE8DD|nr:MULTISPECIES: DUF4325 domain-containing protein [unclassified Amycolatopsis]